MTYPAQTTGLGVAAQVVVAGNVNPVNKTPGYNNVFLSLTGAGAPSTFQLEPNVEDVAGGEITPGTAFVLASVAASSIGVLTLSAAAAASGGTTLYTGTITGGGSNAFAGDTFTIAGFDNAANNGVFLATASTSTTLTLSNANGVADTHAGTATPEQGTAVYTGTITGGGSSAFAGQTFVVAGFTGANNNGTFLATASSATTLTLVNDIATVESHAATATSQEAGSNQLTYVAYGSRNVDASHPTGRAVVTVSATGLVTAQELGSTIVEVSYPTFNNSEPAISSSGNIMNGLPNDKVYAEVNVTVGP